MDMPWAASVRMWSDGSTKILSGIACLVDALRKYGPTKVVNVKSRNWVEVAQLPMGLRRALGMLRKLGR